MNLSLFHLVRQPKVVVEKNPLILLIHGYGSNEQDLFSLASELPETHYVISIRAPYDLQYGSYAWYAINFDADENKFSNIEQASTSRDLIIKFIDELSCTYPINTSDISLLGFSQGAILSYAIALSYPEKISKVAAFSGYLNLEMVVPTIENKSYSHLKIFTSHGTADQVIPVDWARKVKPQLATYGIEITYKEYPIGHGISPQNFSDFKNWFLEK